jgi:hypothetical protein
MINPIYSFVRKASLETIPVVLAMTAVVLSSTIFEKTKTKEINIHPEFKSAIFQVLNDKSQIQISEAVLILDALLPKTVEGLNTNSSLRPELVKLHYGIVSGKSDTELTPEQRKSWGDNVKELISKLDEVAPFQRLHPIEASIFQDISALNKNPELDRKLTQLSNLVQARFEELEETKTEARWSLIFGIAGVVGAIVSIFISVFQSTRKPNNAINSDN